MTYIMNMFSNNRFHFSYHFLSFHSRFCNILLCMYIINLFCFFSCYFHIWFLFSFSSLSLVAAVAFLLLLLLFVACCCCCLMHIPCKLI